MKSGGPISKIMANIAYFSQFITIQAKYFPRKPQNDTPIQIL